MNKLFVVGRIQLRLSIVKPYYFSVEVLNTPVTRLLWNAIGNKMLHFRRINGKHFTGHLKIIKRVFKQK